MRGPPFGRPSPVLVHPACGRTHRCVTRQQSERNLNLRQLSLGSCSLVRDYVASTSARALGRSSQKSKTSSAPPKSITTVSPPTGVWRCLARYAPRWSRADLNRCLSEKPPSIDVRNFRGGATAKPPPPPVDFRQPPQHSKLTPGLSSSTTSTFVLLHPIITFRRLAGRRKDR